MLRLPEEEGIFLPATVTRQIIEMGDGDVALLYVALLRRRGAVDDDILRAELHWDTARFKQTLEKLETMRLIFPCDAHPPREAPDDPEAPPLENTRMDYTREDVTCALKDEKFNILLSAVEDKLGRRLPVPDVATLLGLYNDLGLPADVIFLLVSFCLERIVTQYGAGRTPTLRQIEREGYIWARQGIMTQESASAYIRNYQQCQKKIPSMMRALRLGNRKPSPTEEKYLLCWENMGFPLNAIELAYDRTIISCKELKWPYMHKILLSWDHKGLHTLEEIRQSDAAAHQISTPSHSPTPHAPSSNPREDMARMEKYLQQMQEQGIEQVSTESV